MKYLFSGCLHLGGGSGADDFGDNDSRFKIWFKQFKVDILGLIGDIFDLDQEEYDRIYREHKELMDYFHSINSIYIKGNHDSKMVADDSFFLRMRDGRTVYIAHGHKWDSKRMKSPLVKGIVKFLSIIERIPFLSWIDNPEKWLKKHHQKVVDQTERYANKLLKKYDVVVFFHTHRPCLIASIVNGKKKIYANGGCCLDGNFNGVIIDTDKNDVRLV